MMRYCTALVAVFATVSAISGAGSAQDFMAEPGAPAAAFPKTDRPVANIVSAVWHDEKERDAAGEPVQFVRLLGIKSGVTIADIGAGSGYYVVRLSPIVGAGGRVIAEDIKPEYLRNLRKRVRDLGLQNVTISLGEPHDPRLPADSLDVAILVHMYHEIAQPYALLYNLVPALKPGARVGIIDAFAPTSERHATQCPAVRACSRGVSRDQPRSARRQQRLSGHLRATLRCKPHASGGHRRMQVAIATASRGRGPPTGRIVTRQDQ